jgi:hypothetical protein
MRRSAFLSVFMSLAGATSAQNFDGAVLRGSSGFAPAAPVYAADAAGPSFPIDADAPTEPPVAVPGLPAVREFRVELGARYWYSNGSFAKNLFDDPRFSSNLNSRLTFGSMTGRSYELFGRVDHASGFFLKGFVGLGSLDGGTLVDEDFIVPYSSTTSDQRSGRLRLALQSSVDEFFETDCEIIVMARELLVASQRRSLRRKSFPAIAVTTRTRDRRVRTDYHVAKFAGSTALTTIDLTVKDDSRTYALRHQHKYEITRVPHFRPAKPKFGERHGIRIVIQGYR